MTRLFVRYHESKGPIIVEENGKEQNAHRVEILGPSRMVTRKNGEQPHIWLETEAEIVVHE